MIAVDVPLSGSHPVQVVGICLVDMSVGFALVLGPVRGSGWVITISRDSRLASGRLELLLAAAGLHTLCNSEALKRGAGTPSSSASGDGPVD